jgi:hypothetical protein
MHADSATTLRFFSEITGTEPVIANVRRHLHAMKYKVAFICSGLLCAALFFFWMFSYKSYGLIAREAYSGLGTELASVRGLLVFYYFDNYEDFRPPQDWSYGFVQPQSRSGQRLGSDFNFWQAPYWWSRLGFFYLSFDPFIKRILLISIPYWYLTLICAFSCAFFYRRLGRSKPQIEQATSTPNAA